MTLKFSVAAIAVAILAACGGKEASDVTDAAAGVVDSAKSATETVVADAGDAVDGMVKDAGDAVNEMATEAGDAVDGMVKDASDAMDEMAKDAGDVVNQVAGVSSGAQVLIDRCVAEGETAAVCGCQVDAVENALAEEDFDKLIEFTENDDEAGAEAFLGEIMSNTPQVAMEMGTGIVACIS